jgi:hypothetical protein
MGLKMEMTTPEQQMTYLRNLVQHAITQKVRIQGVVDQYEANYKQVSEDVIDQNDLVETIKEDLGLA